MEVQRTLTGEVKMRLARLAAAGLLAVLAACGGSSPTENTNNNNNNPPPPPPGGANVTIKDFTFSPETVTVKVGSSVQWVNNGPSAHHVLSDDMVFDAGNLSGPSGSDPYGYGDTKGQTFTFKFDNAGTFNYHCANHPPSGYPNFVGVVVVTP
jgi:plastocyanin